MRHGTRRWEPGARAARRARDRGGAGDPCAHARARGRRCRPPRAGSTSNHFRTRSALLHATVDQLAQEERRAFAPAGAPATSEELVEALAGVVAAASGPHRGLAAARYAFFAEGVHDPHVRATLARAREGIEMWTAQTLEGIGVPRPFAAARRVLTYLDGAILHRLVFGDTGDLRDDLGALVRSCAE